jgi:hypothetical protein
MAKRDITKANIAIDKLLETTTNPRHRYILQAYSRHRYLEVSGRVEEIFTPDMISDNPMYNLHALGFNQRLTGLDQIKPLYRMWAETNQCIFYTENEQVAVADNFVASSLTAYQQVWGGSLLMSKGLALLPKGLSHDLLMALLDKKGLKAEPTCMYLYRNFEETIWPYDDRGRLMREDVWEPQPENAEIIKLEPEDVVTTAQAAVALAPLIKPLPNFDEYVLGAKAATGD